jgi:hypothetical protein
LKNFQLERRTAVKKQYHVIEKQGKPAEEELRRRLVRHGQVLLPLLALIEGAQQAVDEGSMF